MSAGVGQSLREYRSKSLCGGVMPQRCVCLNFSMKMKKVTGSMCGNGRHGIGDDERGEMMRRLKMAKSRKKEAEAITVVSSLTSASYRNVMACCQMCLELLIGCVYRMSVKITSNTNQAICHFAVGGEFSWRYCGAR